MKLPPQAYSRILAVLLVGQRLADVRVQHDELQLHVVGLCLKIRRAAHLIRLPLLSVELLDVDGVVELLLDSVDHIVSCDFRLGETTSNTLQKETERRGDWASSRPARGSHVPSRFCLLRGCTCSARCYARADNRRT